MAALRLSLREVAIRSIELRGATPTGIFGADLDHFAAGN